MFVRGGDGALYQKSWVAGSGWTGWIRHGQPMLSAPTVSVRRGTGILDLFWRGGDNGIEAMSWVPGSGWTDVNNTQLDPGATLSAPAAISRNSGQVDVIVRGTDDGLYLNAYNGSGWSGWGGLPGGMKTQHAPAATVRTLNTIDIFVRSNAGEVRWITWDGAAWSGWKTVPGGVDSGPAVVADTSQRMWLFARRGGDVVYNVYDAGRGPEDGWDGWKLLHPPPPAPPPPPACDLAAGRLTAHAKLVRFGKRPRLAGRARRTDGAPLVSATITASPARGGWTRTATADANGFYVMRLPPGPTRRIDVKALAPGAGSLACKRAIVRTRAGVTLKTNRRVRPGGTVRFRGRLKGSPGAAPRQARGAAGVRRRQVAHVRAAALAQERALQGGLPAAPHVRPADVHLPRPRAPRGRLPLRAGLLAQGQGAGPLTVRRASRPGASAPAGTRRSARASRRRPRRSSSGP